MQMQRECIALSPVKKQYKKSGIASVFRSIKDDETTIQITTALLV